MSYTMNYSFFDESGESLTPLYVDSTGTTGAEVRSAGNFELNGWYGFTLIINEEYQGFIGFFLGTTCRALFATNPQEGENLDIKSSTLELKGPGGISYPVTVTDTSNNPIQGVQVWLTSDPEGDNVVAGTLLTDSSGTATFEVPAGTYFLWRLSGKYTIPNPKTVTVS